MNEIDEMLDKTEAQVFSTPPVDPLGELAGAHILAEISGGNLGHDAVRGLLYFDGKRWAPAEKKARVICYKVGDERRKQGHAATKDPDLIKAYYRAAKRDESRAGIEAILSLAANLPGIAMDHIEFDADPFALNFLNGTVDLRTGLLRPHRKEDYLTKIIPHNFDPTALCPRFLKFLDEVFKSDKQIVYWMQWLVGYTAIGATPRHILPILYGTGRNGKSVLFKILRYVFGRDYAVSIDPEDLMAKQGNNNNNSIPRLRGARFAMAQETAENRRIDEALVKMLTGGDPITGRELYGKQFEFVPSHTLWMATNYRPRITGAAPAIWERVRLVPFERYFESYERDHDLDATLAAEAVGILAWIVNGARMKEPLIPERVRKATDEYREESDVLAAFIEEYLTTEWEHANTLKSEVYEAYKRARNNHCEGFIEFNKRLETRGFKSVKKRHGACWEGVAIKAKYASCDVA